MQNQDTEKTQDYQVILEKIKGLEKEMQKQRSWKRIISRAIINGIFASFGATIIFAIILIIFSQLIKSADQIPIINDIIDRTKLEKIIDDQKEESNSFINVSDEELESEE